MKDTKLEVGQVWQDADYQLEVLRIFEKDGLEHVALLKSLNGVIVQVCSQLSQVILDFYSLITNPDGTPHNKPNIYIAGDIWTRQVSFDDKFIDYFIYKLPDGVLCFQCKDGKCGHVADNFLKCPQDYRLIFRGGKAVING